ncbi:MAG: hypothetical protein MIN69_00475 [Methylorubrum extorquens]|jgi:hypothetical protein|uniref:hypothetical protein n=1 Tax=Methylorubrum extorquens TaxID=408 RepID=UPI002FEE3CDF
MEIEQVAELARAVAALPQEQQDFFDGVVADERAAAAEAERIAQLRAMTDYGAIQVAVKRASDGRDPDGLPARLLKELRDAGFVRQPAEQPKVDLPEAITRVREVIQEIDGMVRRGIPISNAPSLRHWLMRGLDALTGENHSGFETSLPQPKTKLV